MAYGAYENIVRVEKEKSLLGKHHSNCFRKGPLVDAKISGQKFQEKQELQSLNGSPQKILLNYQEKDSNLTL